MRVDAENRFLWRMNRTRLDAESTRDAMLQVSGKLDLKMGGPGIQQFFFKDDHSPVYDYTLFDIDSPVLDRFSDEDRAGLDRMVAAFMDGTDFA